MNSFLVIAGDAVLFRSSSKAAAQSFLSGHRRPCVLFEAKPVGGIKAEDGYNGATIHGSDVGSQVTFQHPE